MFGRLDVVVNNAGYGLLGALEECDVAQMRRSLDTNLLGPIFVMQAALPILRAQKSGHILNLSAIAAFSNHPGFSVYGAAKAGLEAASDALRQEVAPLGISVTLVSPGPYRTDFIGRSMERASGHIADYDRTSGKFGSTWKRLMDGSPAIRTGLLPPSSRWSMTANPPPGCFWASTRWKPPAARSPKCERDLAEWEAVSLATDF